ncbi:MAG: peptide MFS transporter [Sphingobacteriaceae bacterium]|nr:peptide MFS transporter [Sphingobacteriaceae bacterium]
MTTETTTINEDQVLDQHLTSNGVETTRLISHPVGLFILFFTEMWERFSYYGMRSLLTIFLITEIEKGGWQWTRPEALKLYGWYTGLIYLTPIVGGLIADRLTGYKKAIILGGLIMVMGHASMAMEGFDKNFFFLGLLLMILGNGLFKPNISSMVGQLYPSSVNKKKDAAYTIFYMGINAGSFLGMLFCGYLGEKIGWHLGFGLAGLFMFFGTLQFYFAQKIFGVLGKKAEKKTSIETTTPTQNTTSKKIEIQRLWVIVILSLFTIFFWMLFEQAGGSMAIFAKDYTLRKLTGGSGLLFKWTDALLFTLFPLIAVTVVLVGLAKQIFKKHPITILCTALSFLIIWGLAIWKIDREFSDINTEVTVSWFGTLNAFFIITLAPFFSKLWETKFNPSGGIKFGFGLIFLGIGFAGLAYASTGIAKGATTAQVSIFWLVFAYLFHSIGELCVSPVGLSYVSKLAPAKLVGLMFGFWFTCTAIGNWLAGETGGMIDYISSNYSIAVFFAIFAIIPVFAGLAMFVLNPLLKKWMHGVS